MGGRFHALAALCLAAVLRMDLVIAKFDGAGALINGADLNVIEASQGVSDFILSSHGWWTTAGRAQSEYAQFDAGCENCFGRRRGALPVPPDAQILPIGIEWPSMVADNLGAFTDIFEAFSYDDMRQRAEAVGGTGVADLIRRVWGLANANRRLRIHLLGHSLGCRVMCVALQAALRADAQPVTPGAPGPAPLATVFQYARINVVLFQGAIDNNTLERTQKYGVLSAAPGLRVLVTRSDLDGVLASYPSDVDPNPGMGAKGPTAATFTDPVSRFHNERGDVSVNAGADCTVVSGRTETFVVADLTPLHRADRQHNPALWNGISGNHSDIFTPEVYELATGFLFSQVE